MKTYAIVDLANLYHRARHVVRGDAFTKSGMILHILFRSLRKLHREFSCDHFVLCLEGGTSWRSEVYPGYKGRRRAERAELLMSEKEREEDEILFAALKDFCDFAAEKTSMTVLQSPRVEGDDFVARWTQLHPEDNHIILSGDSDFIQLISDRVSIYNGIDEVMMTASGLRDGRGKELAFRVDPAKGKIKVLGTVEEMKKKHDTEEKKKLKDDPTHGVEPYSFTPEPKWWQKALFIKIIRGDTSDSIFSAFPGVRYEGSKNRIGIREAWEDRTSQGYSWNNFMLSRWEKLEGKDEGGNSISRSVRVLDEFLFNECLIDLTKQPEGVIALMDECIIQAVQKDTVGNIGFNFMKFCGKHDLPKLSQEVVEHSAYLKASYNG